MPGIFDEPFIDRIERDANLGKAKNIGRYTKETDIDQVVTEETIPDDMPGDVISPSDTTKSLKSVSNVDTISQPLEEVLTRLKNIVTLADQTELEADIVIRRHVENMNLDLTSCPQTIIDYINTLTKEQYSNDPDSGLPTSICQGNLQCINKLSKFGGDYPSIEDIDEYSESLENAEDLADAFNDLADDKVMKMTGWEMFMFMVKFIAAYTVHMILGFLCCFFKDKLVIKVPGMQSITDGLNHIPGVKFKNPGVMYIGRKISKLFGKAERYLKKKLGYPCRDSEKPDCIDADGGPSAGMFNILPCCSGSNVSSCNGDELGDDDEDTMGECYAKAIQQYLDEAQGEKSNPGYKQCSGCNGLANLTFPDGTTISAKTNEIADTVMDWFIATSAAKELEGKNENNTTGTQSGNVSAASSIKNYAKHSSHITKKLKKVIEDNKESFKQKNDDECAILKKEGIGELLNPLDDMSPEDLRNAMLKNMDTDFSKFLDDPRNKYEASGCNPTPQLPALAVICKATEALDLGIGDVLKEARKYLALIKNLEGILTTRDFCCIVFTVVFVSNLARHQALCPEEDITNLFRFSDKLKTGKDLDKVICEIEFLKNLIETLQAELLEDLSIIGLTLPLGTLLEILKKIVANVVTSLAALALAPLQKLLDDLENAPGLQDLLNSGCYGIGDLLLMIKCGIDWILDLIKEWAEDLIPLSAKNIELIPDLRVGGFKFAFLAQLSDLLGMLLDLLTNIGDCYTPEVIVDEIINGIDAKTINQYKAKIKAENTNPTGDLFKDIPGVDEDPTAEIISEMENGKGAEGTTFPIYAKEMTKFIETVKQNTIPLSEITTIDENDKIVFDEELFENFVGIRETVDTTPEGTDSVSNEESTSTINKTRKNLLNMVEILISYKGNN